MFQEFYDSMQGTRAEADKKVSELEQTNHEQHTRGDKFIKPRNISIKDRSEYDINESF